MMKKATGLLLGLAAISGCANDEASRRDPAKDAQDVAMVERLSRAPFRPIRPEPLTGEDIDRYDLARDGCMFRPGSDAKEAPVFVAQKDRGYLKIDGRLQPLAVKSGSSELPSGAHSTYVGTENWVELVAQATSEGRGAGGKGSWPSRLIIHDANERIAFDAPGHVSCRGSDSGA
ncbi:hypothetical protein [Novosphingobium sp. M1R2S20]|uniref:Lipoprotein n=1 Tax=Novosphingobium rhizovicinum TaxID=3228928 RepID=A0ABV3RFG6_9SPHN